MREVRVIRTIAAPIEDVFDWMTDSDNYRRVPGVLRADLVQPGAPTRQGPGAVRDVVTVAMKLTERIVELDRPHLMRYLVLRSVPSIRHESGSMSFESDGRRTTVTWVSRFEATTPMLADMATALFAVGIAAGFRGVLRTADKELGRRG